MAGSQDVFVNKATISVAESAINTLTFKKLETGVEMMSGRAWVVHRVDYHLANVLGLANLDGNADNIQFGLANSNSMTTPAATDDRIRDYNAVYKWVYGTPATQELILDPLVIKDFTNLPGGGLIMVPNPLYLFVKGGGDIAVVGVIATLYYTSRDLKQDEFFDLWQSTVMLQS